MARQESRAPLTDRRAPRRGTKTVAAATHRQAKCQTIIRPKRCGSPDANDLSTPVDGGGTFGSFSFFGAEIDLFGYDAGDTNTRAFVTIGKANRTVTLTSGTPNYLGTTAISGSDIMLSNNPGALHTLDVFRRSLTHEIGHSLGLRDSEDEDFIDDNYDGTNSATALATLTNSWASLVDPFDPAASSLSIFTVPNADPGLDTSGVDVLMEGEGLGIAPGNPISNLVQRYS